VRKIAPQNFTDLQMSTIWNEGYRTAINNKNNGENPYLDGDIRQNEWDAGFNQAIQDLKDRKNDNDI